MKPSSSTDHSEKASNTLQGTNPLYDALKDSLIVRRGSFRPQPKNTVLYEVQESDTLASIAARFNTTPSELVILNKLGCRTIFPSQIIYVPDVSGQVVLGIQSTARRTDEPPNGRYSPKPGHVCRVGAVVNEAQFTDATSSHRSPSQIAEDLNKQSLSKFLKINAKHITDGEGVVSGVLLVTPNHLMFDPNVSDPLVMEHGVEKYGVVAPIHMVARTALYTDIVRMRVKGCAELKSEDNSLKIYHSKRLAMKKSYSESNPDYLEQCFSSPQSSEIPDEQSDAFLRSSISDDLQKNLSKISELSLDVNKDNDPKSKSTAQLTDVHSPFSKSASILSPEKDNVCPVTTSVLLDSSSKVQEQQSNEEETEDISMISGEQASTKKSTFERTKYKLHKGLLKLPLAESLFNSSVNHRRMSLPTSSSFQELKTKVMPSTSTKKTKSKDDRTKSESSTTSYMNMVDDKPELFASLDKLIPRPAKSFDDNPLYLCLRMGQPLFPSAVTRVTPVMDFGCTLKQEYWFSIPRAKVDSLYWFLLRWIPDRYGEVYDINLEELGFSPLIKNEDEELESPPPQSVRTQRSASWAFPWRRKKSVDITEKKKDPDSLSWEYVNTEDVEVNLDTSDTSLPEMLNPSDILTEDHIQKLSRHLPARAVSYAWSLIYSTAVHGFSLKTLYREMSNFDTPVLLVIASTTGAVFGAMLSCPLRLSDHFYGTGESFLFTFYPEFKYFNWSGENAYFIKGNTGSFAIGASDGQFGLWLDDDLFHGCSKSCRTFDNDCLCEQEDFIVKALEAWGFV